MKLYKLTKQLSQFTIFLIIFNVLTSSLFSQQSLNDSLVTERLHAIEQILNQGKHNASVWWYGWLIGYSAATIGQGVVMATSDSRATRQDMATGGITTILGAAGQLITPMDPALAPAKLELISEGTPDERMTKLAAAETLLKESAERERSGRSWQTHAVCAIVNVGSGLVTWFGFHRNALAGLENFALNTVITEVQIFSQPTRAMKDYRAYQKKYTGLQSSNSRNNEVRLLVFAIPGGVGARIIF